MSSSQAILAAILAAEEALKNQALQASLVVHTGTATVTPAMAPLLDPHIASGFLDSVFSAFKQSGGTCSKLNTSGLTALPDRDIVSYSNTKTKKEITPAMIVDVTYQGSKKQQVDIYIIAAPQDSKKREPVPEVPPHAYWVSYYNSKYNELNSLLQTANPGCTLFIHGATEGVIDFRVVPNGVTPANLTNSRKPTIKELLALVPRVSMMVSDILDEYNREKRKPQPHAWTYTHPANETEAEDILMQQVSAQSKALVESLSSDENNVAPLRPFLSSSSSSSFASPASSVSSTTSHDSQQQQPPAPAPAPAPAIVQTNATEAEPLSSSSSSSSFTSSASSVSQQQQSTPTSSSSTGSAPTSPTMTGTDEQQKKRQEWAEREKQQEEARLQKVQQQQEQLRQQQTSATNAGSLASSSSSSSFASSASSGSSSSSSGLGTLSSQQSTSSSLSSSSSSASLQPGTTSQTTNDPLNELRDTLLALKTICAAHEEAKKKYQQELPPLEAKKQAEGERYTQQIQQIIDGKIGTPSPAKKDQPIALICAKIILDIHALKAPIDDEIAAVNTLLRIANEQSPGFTASNLNENVRVFNSMVAVKTDLERGMEVTRKKTVSDKPEGDDEVSEEVARALQEIVEILKSIKDHNSIATANHIKTLKQNCNIVKKHAPIQPLSCLVIYFRLIDISSSNQRTPKRFFNHVYEEMCRISEDSETTSSADSRNSMGSNRLLSFILNASRVKYNILTSESEAGKGKSDEQIATENKRIQAEYEAAINTCMDEYEGITLTSTAEIAPPWTTRVRKGATAAGTAILDGVNAVGARIATLGKSFMNLFGAKEKASGTSAPTASSSPTTSKKPAMSEASGETLRNAGTTIVVGFQAVGAAIGRFWKKMFKRKKDNRRDTQAIFNEFREADEERQEDDEMFAEWGAQLLDEHGNIISPKRERNSSRLSLGTAISNASSSSSSSAATDTSSGSSSSSTTASSSSMPPATTTTGAASGASSGSFAAATEDLTAASSVASSASSSSASTALNVLSSAGAPALGLLTLVPTTTSATNPLRSSAPPPSSSASAATAVATITAAGSAASSATSSATTTVVKVAPSTAAGSDEVSAQNHVNQIVNILNGDPLANLEALKKLIELQYPKPTENSFKYLYTEVLFHIVNTLVAMQGRNDDQQTKQYLTFLKEIVPTLFKEPIAKLSIATIMNQYNGSVISFVVNRSSEGASKCFDKIQICNDIIKVFEQIGERKPGTTAKGTVKSTSSLNDFIEQFDANDAPAALREQRICQQARVACNINNINSSNKEPIKALRNAYVVLCNAMRELEKNPSGKNLSEVNNILEELNKLRQFDAAQVHKHLTRAIVALKKIDNGNSGLEKLDEYMKIFSAAPVPAPAPPAASYANAFLSLFKGAKQTPVTPVAFSDSDRKTLNNAYILWRKNPKDTSAKKAYERALKGIPLPKNLDLPEQYEIPTDEATMLNLIIKNNVFCTVDEYLAIKAELDAKPLDALQALLNALVAPFNEFNAKDLDANHTFSFTPEQMLRHELIKMRIEELEANPAATSSASSSSSSSAEDLSSRNTSRSSSAEDLHSTLTSSVQPKEEKEGEEKRNKKKNE